MHVDCARLLVFAFSGLVQNRSCYLTQGVFFFLQFAAVPFVAVCQPLKRISHSLASWTPPPKLLFWVFMVLLVNELQYSTSKISPQKKDVNPDVTQKACVELCVPAWQAISNSFFGGGVLFGLFPLLYSVLDMGHSSARSQQSFSNTIQLSQMPHQQHLNQQTIISLLNVFALLLLKLEEAHVAEARRHCESCPAETLRW